MKSCMVATCPTLVPEAKVACTFHWSLVSMELKRRIWSVYEDELGQSALVLALYAAAEMAMAGDKRKTQHVG